MKAQIKKQLNGTTYTFNFSEKDDKEALVQAGFFASMPEKCDKCGSDNVHLSSNRAQGYSFVQMTCDECGAQTQVGEYKEGGFFWKDWKTRKEIMNKGSNQQSAPQPGSNQARQQANAEAQQAAQQDSPGKAPQGQAENVPVDA